MEQVVKFSTVACELGHVQDFPWWEWIFRSRVPDVKNQRLRMRSAGSASLAGVRDVCEEDGSKNIKVVESGSLQGALHFKLGQPSPLTGINVLCRGGNPALGIPSATQPPPGCGRDLYPLLRGGSNVYFPRVESAIYLPMRDNLADDEVLEIIDDHRVWSFLSMIAESDPVNTVSPTFAETALSRFYPGRTVSPDDVAKAANRRIQGGESSDFVPVDSDTPHVAFRRQEFDLLSRDAIDGYSKKNLMVRRSEVESFESPISDWFSRISLVHKLRETRAFVGFSRIYPSNTATLVYTADGDSEGSMGGLVRMARPGKFEPTLRRALEKAAWCSSDPVCMESTSQGSDGCNLAACHSCALVPETTCEEQNRLLDRGIVISTLQSPNSGYFNFCD